ncbi:hypothetical protein Tco_1319611 [Tanacetum coccineum]
MPHIPPLRKQPRITINREYLEGGPHITNVPQFDVEDFSSWKDKFLVYLDGLEPNLLEILENGVFVPKSPTSTLENALTKPQKQWSLEDLKLVNQDKRLKRHEGSFETRDTKIAALRLKFNAFKALEAEKGQQTYTRLKKLLNDLETKDVIIPQVGVNATFVKNYQENDLIDQIYESETNGYVIQRSNSKALISNTYFKESDSDVEEDTRSSKEFLADLNQNYYDRALLPNQQRFYKRSGKVGYARKPMYKSNETHFTCGKQGHFQKD